MVQTIVLSIFYLQIKSLCIWYQYSLDVQHLFFKWAYRVWLQCKRKGIIFCQFCIMTFLYTYPLNYVKYLYNFFTNMCKMVWFYNCWPFQLKFFFFSFFSFAQNIKRSLDMQQCRLIILFHPYAIQIVADIHLFTQCFWKSNWKVFLHK